MKLKIPSLLIGAAFSGLVFTAIQMFAVKSSSTPGEENSASPPSRLAQKSNGNRTKTRSYSELSPTIKFSVSNPKLTSQDYLRLSYEVMSFSEAEVKQFIEDLLNDPEAGYTDNGSNLIYIGFQRWAQLNPEAAFERVKTLDSWKQNNMARAVFYEWALLNPRACLLYTSDAADD